MDRIQRKNPIFDSTCHMIWPSKCNKKYFGTLFWGVLLATSKPVAIEEWYMITKSEVTPEEKHKRTIGLGWKPMKRYYNVWTGHITDTQCILAHEMGSVNRNRSRREVKGNTRYQDRQLMQMSSCKCSYLVSDSLILSIKIMHEGSYFHPNSREAFADGISLLLSRTAFLASLMHSLKFNRTFLCNPQFMKLPTC